VSLDIVTRLEIRGRFQRPQEHDKLSVYAVVAGFNEPLKSPAIFNGGHYSIICAKQESGRRTDTPLRTGRIPEHSRSNCGDCE
jgi:hypothetical protein